MSSSDAPAAANAAASTAASAEASTDATVGVGAGSDASPSGTTSAPASTASSSSTSSGLSVSDLDRQIVALRNCEYLKESEVKVLCNKAREILVDESNVQRVDAPVTVSDLPQT